MGAEARAPAPGMFIGLGPPACWSRDWSRKRQSQPCQARNGRYEHERLTCGNGARRRQPGRPGTSPTRLLIAGFLVQVQAREHL